MPVSFERANNFAPTAPAYAAALVHTAWLALIKSTATACFVTVVFEATCK